jgi:effector-binding domain-containing protein
MLSQPELVDRKAQHYAVIQTQVSIPFGKVLGPLWAEVGAWLASRNIKPSGAPIIRYLSTDMANKMDIEVGFPVASPVKAAGRVSAVTLPAGRYAVLTYTGSYRGKGLYKATVVLLEWAEQNHITWQKKVIDHVDWWDARFESYLTDPAVEPDPKKWQTELIFLTAEAQTGK